MKSRTSTSSFKGAPARMAASSPGLAVACALLLFIGCSAGVPKPGAESPDGPTTPPSTPDPADITVALSSLTPHPAQGRVTLFDYDGPEFDEEDLRVSIGGEGIRWVFLEPWIGVLLPLSHEGPTTLTFDAGGGQSASVVLNIGRAPLIADSRQYVTDKVAALTTSVDDLVVSDAAYREAHDALVELQSRLAGLSERDLHELAIYIKQNIEPMLFSSPGTADAGLVSAFVSEECSISLRRFIQGVVGVVAGAYTVALAPATGPLSLVGVAVGAAAYVLSAKVAVNSVPEVYDKCVQVEVSSIQDARSSFGADHDNRHLFSAGASGVSLLRFDDGQNADLTITLSRTLFSRYRADIVNNVAKIRSSILSVKSIVGKVTTRFDVAFDALLKRFPETVEGTETAAARGFTLLGTSDGNVTGDIVSNVGETLSLRFSFGNRSAVQGEYVDFNFTLANEAEGLDDTVVPARLYVVTCADHVDILLAAKDELGGTTTTTLNWDRNLELYLWDGVTTADGRCITSLSLSGNLTGSIPASLGSLSSLEYLSLDDNQLTGPIPASLGNLSSLKGLWLGDNQLTGSIPASLGSLSSLEDLSLTNNQLTGSIPESLGNLSSLRGLWLYDNQLTGSIPASLGNLSSLKGLWLGDNQLTGSIPASLGSLSSLEDLSLINNQLTGSIPESLGSLSSLKDLWIYDNQLTGSIPASLGNLSSLEDLSLGNNQLTGSIPASLGNLSSLEDLSLGNNQLTGSIPASLGNLSSLENLWLDDNQLTGSIPASLGNLSGSIWLILTYNRLSGCIPRGMTTYDVNPQGPYEYDDLQYDLKPC